MTQQSQSRTLRVRTGVADPGSVEFRAVRNPSRRLAAVFVPVNKAVVVAAIPWIKANGGMANLQPLYRNASGGAIQGYLLDIPMKAPLWTRLKAILGSRGIVGSDIEEAPGDKTSRLLTRKNLKRKR